MTSVLTKTYGGLAFSVEHIEALQAVNTLRNGMIHLANVEYATETRHYTQVDCPTNADLMKGMLTGDIRLDGAILVVAATEGVMEETREQVRLSMKIGVPAIVVFLNKCDLVRDEELLNLVESEVRELLSSYGFPGDEVPVIRGSARMALQGDEVWSEKILRLAEAMDGYIPEPERPLDKPFLMPIEDVFTVTGRGTVATGRIETGSIQVGEEVEIVGMTDTRRTTCTGVEMFRKLLDVGITGDNVGVLLRGAQRGDVQRGQVLAKPNSIKAHTQFESEVYVLPGKTTTNFILVDNNRRPQFYFRTTDIPGTIELPHGVKTVQGDEVNTFVVNLINPIAMNEGQYFQIRVNGLTIGFGVVTQIIE